MIYFTYIIPQKSTNVPGLILLVARHSISIQTSSTVWSKENQYIQPCYKIGPVKYFEYIAKAVEYYIMLPLHLH